MKEIISKIFPEHIEIEILPDGEIEEIRRHFLNLDEEDELTISEKLEKDSNGELIRVGIKTKKNNEICLRLRKCNHNGEPHININLIYNGHQKNKDKFKKEIFPKSSHSISPIPNFLRIIVKQNDKEVYKKDIMV